ncbi:MAG: hypothetical protein IT159_11430 [Bryobacterales bacterium]|nr:hypothetical protein [Bryobacterales bacterium]
MKPCRLEDLSGWLEEEAASIPDEAHRRVLLEISINLDWFVKWPKRAELLWEGCDRRRENAQQQRYHAYPPELKTALPAYRFQDRRSNRPAIMAYRVAGGERPLRSNGRGWNIHHFYDGKFPYPGNSRPSLQAVKEARHFTQSAGLVAVHPFADALADEFTVFAWRLRAESFRLFGYDPEGAFTGQPDEYGFAGRKCEKIWHYTT